MFRIRFHGRGGQGMKTASRILGSAFFLDGYEVQDAPRYGAERRGAPIFAYVRADKKTINQRGIIRRPDLVVVADDSLISIPAAGVLAGVTEHTVMLFNSHESAETWQQRLNIPGPILILPATEEVADRAELKYVGAACAAAAARLTGKITRSSLEQAVRDELGSLGQDVVDENISRATEAFELMAEHQGLVTEGEDISAAAYEEPGWIDFPFEQASVSAPDIHGGLTSVEVRTGLWRTMRPVIDYDHCNRCWWVCSTFCPDSAIQVNDKGYPEIDYDHCKGCLVCVAKCPPHAIGAVSEYEARQAEEASA
jgi:pyruvate ferredoxin oxidoreductase gamma subunit